LAVAGWAAQQSVLKRWRTYVTDYDWETRVEWVR
jgi:hypothetical protein